MSLRPSECSLVPKKKTKKNIRTYIFAVFCTIYHSDCFFGSQLWKDCWNDSFLSISKSVIKWIETLRSDDGENALLRYGKVWKKNNKQISLCSLPYQTVAYLSTQSTVAIRLPFILEGFEFQREKRWTWRYNRTKSSGLIEVFRGYSEDGHRGRRMTHILVHEKLVQVPAFLLVCACVCLLTGRYWCPGSLAWPKTQ